MAEKKTANMAEYQKAYRAANPLNKEKVNSYMKEYIAKAESLTCEACQGRYKSYSRYKHEQTEKHLKALLEIKMKEEALKKAEEEAAAAKDLEKPATKKPRKIRIKKEKKAATPEPESKPESLKALEEYGSSDEEEEEEEKSKSSLSDFKVVLKAKKINAEEVAEYIKTHFEASVNPDRAKASKTPRLNKNASLWRKVSGELDGMTFKHLGLNFGKIVAGAYDKPSSQADLAQMLKQVILHFTKVKKPVEEELKGLIRDLKQEHITSKSG